MQNSGAAGKPLSSVYHNAWRLGHIHSTICLKYSVIVGIFSKSQVDSIHSCEQRTLRLSLPLVKWVIMSNYRRIKIACESC